MSKHVIISMSSNSEDFDLQEGQEWKSCTLERCNLVYTNSTEQTYVIHIEQMPDELLSCISGSTYNQVGTFVVGDEPFNHTENHTVWNHRPSKPLDALTVKIYDMSGNAASITNPFHIRMRINKP